MDNFHLSFAGGKIQALLNGLS